MNTFKMFGREWEKLDFKPWSGPDGEGEPNAWYSPDRVIVQARSVKLEMIPGYVLNFGQDDELHFVDRGLAKKVAPTLLKALPEVMDKLKAAQCGGIRLTESLGYGLYRIRMGSVLNPGVGVVKGTGDPFARQWSPRTTFACWLDWGPNDKREIVYECGQAISDGKGAQFVVFDDPKVNREALRKGFLQEPDYPSDIVFIWTPKRLVMHQGILDSLYTFAFGQTCIYNGSIEPNGELLTINMRTLGYPDITKKTGVTISGFEYLPLDSKKCIETMRRLGL